MTAGVLLFAVSALISTLASLNPRISLWGEHTSYAGLATILAHVMVYFVARALGTSLIAMERLLLACLLAGVVATAFAFLQLSGVDPVGWQSPSDAGAFRRPFGTMGHPNHLGALLAMVFPLVWCFAVPKRRGGMIILGIVLLAGMAVTLSRAAWLGWFAGMTILVGAWARQSWSKINTRRVVWFSSAAVLVVVLLGWGNPRGIVSGFQDRLANLNSGWTRFQMWDTSLDIFRAYPVLGTGPDTFQLAFAPRRTPAFWKQEWNTTPTRAHNEFLQVMATQGTVGALTLVVFLLGLAQAIRRALRHEDPGARRLALALVCGVMVFLVASLFSFTAVGYGPVFLVLAAFLNRLGQCPGVDCPTGFSPKQNEAAPWFRPALLFAATVIFLQFTWNLSFGFSALPGSFWLAILTLGLTITGATVFFLREWPTAHSSVRAGGVFGGSPWIALGAASAVALAMMFLVVRPWLAHVACACGDRMLADNPRLALEDLEQAVALDPSWDIYWTKLARGRHWAALKAGNPQERQVLLQAALAAWDHLTTHNPLNGAHHDNRGQCLARLCQHGLIGPQEVFASFAMAIKLDPLNPLFHADAADAALRLGQNDRAWDLACAGVRDMYQCGPLNGQIGYLLLQKGLLPAAINHLEESLAGFWDDRDDWKQAAQANLTAAYHRTGDYQKLEKLASSFLDQHPEAAVIRALLADAQEKQGSLQDAYRNYRLVLQQVPGHRLARAGCERLRPAIPIAPVSRQKTTP